MTLLVTTFPGHEEVSVRMKPMHKERRDEQRLKVGGQREKSLIVLFERLVPAMPEAALPRNFSVNSFLLFIYSFIFSDVVGFLAFITCML